MQGSGTYISLSEAARISGYSAEYLRRLCIKGIIKGLKIGNAWVTTAEEALNYQKTKISAPPTLPEIAGTTVSAYSRLQKAAAVAIGLVVFLPVVATIIRLPDRINWTKDKTNSFVASTQDMVNQKVQDWLKKELAALGIGKEAPKEAASEPIVLTHPALDAGSSNGKIPAFSGMEIRAGVETEIKGQVAGISISNDDFITSLRNVISAGLPDDVKAQLQGPKGEQGLPGPIGPTSQYIPNSGSVFGVTAPAAEHPGTIGGITYGSSDSFVSRLLTVSSDINQTGGIANLQNTTISNLTVSGSTSFSGGLNSNLLPATDDTYDVGSTDLRFKSLRIGTGDSSFDGNVGIGTTNTSSALLVVQGSGYFTEDLNNSHASGVGEYFTPTATGGVQWQLSATANGNGFGGGKFAIAKGDGTTAYLTVVQNSGNVGIGTTTPNTKLEVAGTAAIATFGYVPANSAGQSDLKIIGSGQQPTNTAATVNLYNVWNNVPRPASIRATGGTWAGGAGVDMAFDTSNYVSGTVERMRITDAGNIGIGTTNPANTLDIATGGGIHITAGIPGSTGMALYNNSGTLTWNGSALATGASVSGTTNYIPKFTGSSSLGNSVIYETGGNIGIGLTNPGFKLQVSVPTPDSNLYLSSVSPSLKFANNDVLASTTMVGILAQSTVNGHYGLVAGDLMLGNYGNSRGNIFINSNYSGTGTTNLILQPSTGNVGIGTTNPNTAAKLQIAGSELISTSDFVLGSVGSGYFSGFLASTGNTNFYTQAYTTGATVFGNMALNAYGGNVGIGITNPEQILHVRGADGVQPQLELDSIAANPTFEFRRANGTTASHSALLNNNVVGQLVFKGYGATAYGTSGIIRSAAAENWSDTAWGSYINFFTTQKTTTSVTERMRIDDVGNVGIGTTNPGTAGLAVMNGNVGIGTTTPGYKLEVDGSFGILSNTASPNPMVTFYSTLARAASNVYGTFYQDSAGEANAFIGVNQYSSGNNAAAIIFKTNGGTGGAGIANTTERMRIDNGGNVGIGTTNPGAVLDVNGRILFREHIIGQLAGGYIQVNGSSSNSWAIDSGGGTAVPGTASTSLGIHNWNGSVWSSPVTILNTGSVGIGTTNPGAVLDISNSTNGTMSLRTGINQGDQAFYYATDTRPAGVNTPRTVMHLSANGTGSQAYGQRWYLKEGKTSGPINGPTDKNSSQLIFSSATEADAYATPADVFTLSGSGNVGIGTTVPAAKLDVRGGNIRIGDFNYSNLQRIGATAYSTSGGQVQIGGWGSDDTTFYPALTVNTNSGGTNALNVGIGTTNPALKLDVAGGAVFSSSLYFSAVNGNTLNSGFGNAGDDSDIWINYRGYNDGQSYFRDFRVGNGKGGQIAFFDGSTSNVTFANYAAGNCCSDIAEFYPSSEPVDAADVMAVDPQAEPGTVKKAQTGDTIIGIVSTNPAIAIEDQHLVIAGGVESYVGNPMKPVIALAGRVPVKISEENGSIHTGDRLTVSKLLPGYAMKMTESGQSIGIALANSTSGTDTVLVFVNLGYQHVDVTANSSGDKIVYDKDIDMSGQNFLNVKSIASMSGKWSINDNGDITANNIKTNKVTTHDLEIFDRKTGDIYCVGIENGDWAKTKGACGDIPTPNSATTPDVLPDPVVPPADPAPVVDPVVSPDPAPADPVTPVQDPTEIPADPAPATP